MQNLHFDGSTQNVPASDLAEGLGLVCTELRAAIHAARGILRLPSADDYLAEIYQTTSSHTHLA